MYTYFHSIQLAQFKNGRLLIFLVNSDVQWLYQVSTLISEPWSPFLAQSPWDILALNRHKGHLLYEYSRFELVRISAWLILQSLMQRNRRRGTRSSFQAHLSNTGTRRAGHLMWRTGTVQASCPSHGLVLSSKYGGQNVLKTCQDGAWSTDCRSLQGSRNRPLQPPQTTRFAGGMQWTGTCRIKNRRHGSDYFHRIECRTLCTFSKLEKKLINDNNVLTVTLLVSATTTSCFFSFYKKWVQKTSHRILKAPRHECKHVS